MINKRRHKRILISGSATLEFRKRGEIQSIQTLIANISSLGIGLYSYSSIKLKTSVVITASFISVDGELKSDSIRGRVISNRKIGNTHLVGIQFDEEINARNQPSLFRHLQGILPPD